LDCNFLVIANNTYAELMTLFHGLKLAKNIGCHHICWYSDSKTNIDIVTKHVKKYHYYAFIREGNATAVLLAKLGYAKDDRFKILDFPSKDLNSFIW